MLHIHEQVIIRKCVGQSVMHPRRGPLAVRPPIRDEDLAAAHGYHSTPITFGQEGPFRCDTVSGDDKSHSCDGPSVAGRGGTG
jgi:hypothetical protein